MKKSILLVLLATFLFFGCISMEGKQKVESDGTSTITYKIDFSEYSPSGGYGSTYDDYDYDYSSYYYDPTIEPNEDFDLIIYEEYENAADYGLNVSVSSYYSKHQRGDPTAYIDITMTNENDYDLEDVELIEVDSYAFVDISFTSSPEEIDDGDYDTVLVDSSSAFVDTGDYPVVYLISFEDQDGEKITVIHVQSFEITENSYENEEEEEEDEEEEDVSLTWEDKLDKFVEAGEENCDEILDEYDDAECEFSDDVLEVTRTVTSEEGEYSFTKSYEFPYYTVYTLELEKLPRLFDEDDNLLLEEDLEIWNDFEDGFSSTFESSINTYITYGLEIEHTVEMPGELMDNNGQTTGKTKKKYNIISQFGDEEPIVLRSREMDWTILGIGIIVLAVIGIAVLLVIIKMVTRAQKKPKPVE